MSAGWIAVNRLGLILQMSILDEKVSYVFNWISSYYKIDRH
jgi:hypothetical protein